MLANLSLRFNAFLLIGCFLCMVFGLGKLLSGEPRVDWRFLTDSAASVSGKKFSPTSGNAGSSSKSMSAVAAAGDSDEIVPAVSAACCDSVLSSGFASSGGASGGRTPRTFRLTAARANTVPFHAKVQ